MNYVISAIAVSCISLMSQAKGSTNDQLWTLSATGSWSEIESTGQDANSGSVSLTRLVGEGSVGVSLATSSGSDAFFNGTEITDRSSLFTSVWVSFPIEKADFNVGVFYSFEDLEGRLTVLDNRFEGLDAADTDSSSEVDSFSVSTAISRTFIAGNWDIIPGAGIGWSKTEVTGTANVFEDVGDPLLLIEEQTGFFGSISLGLGYVAHDKVYLFSDLSGLYTDNGASSSVADASRLGGLRATSRQSPEEAGWAEFSLGASFYATSSVTLSVSAGHTAGREDEELFATTTVSVGF